MHTSGLTADEERRVDRRYEVRLYLLWGRGEAAEFDGVVTDLSAGGCFVESVEQVREGDLVKLRLNIPGRGDLTVWGNVVFWVTDTGFGVRFSAYSQDGARDKLLELLEGGR